MIAYSNLLLDCWVDELLTATYTLNRVMTKLVPSTPFELQTGNEPELTHVRPWRSGDYVQTTS